MPSVEYFAHWMYHGHVQLEAHEHYQKRSWRNRTAILSPGSPLILTVPLKKGKHQQQPIREVGIAYHEPWIHHHIQSLQTAYGKTPFANEVLPGLKDILENRPATLWNLNIMVLDYCIELLSANLTYSLSKAYTESGTEDFIDLRKGIPAGVPFSTHAAIPEYEQVLRLNQSFQANLSILDVLCHLGPMAWEYVGRYASIQHATP